MSRPLLASVVESVLAPDASEHRVVGVQRVGDEHAARGVRDKLKPVTLGLANMQGQYVTNYNIIAQ